jgi:hypothetical protein
MFYSILVIGVFALFSAAFAHKRAIKKGCNPTLWAAISAITFIAAQFLVSLAIGILFIIGVNLWGWGIKESEIFRLISTLAFFVTTFASNWLIYLYLNRTSNKSFDEPPLPPTFESSEN